MYPFPDSLNFFLKNQSNGSKDKIILNKIIKAFTEISDGYYFDIIIRENETNILELKFYYCSGIIFVKGTDIRLMLKKYGKMSCM